MAKHSPFEIVDFVAFLAQMINSLKLPDSHFQQLQRFTGEFPHLTHMRIDSQLSFLFFLSTFSYQSSRPRTA